MIATARKIQEPAVYADAAQVAMRRLPEEPVFCFSAPQLEARAATFQRSFPGTVSFAVKSNPAK